MSPADDSPPKMDARDRPSLTACAGDAPIIEPCVTVGIA
jgi:hypothetical protein